MTGARIRGLQTHASDFDGFWIVRANGFLFQYTMPFTGYLFLEANMTSNGCQHTLSTSDEFGYSSCAAFTNEFVECGVLWKWEDEVLQGQAQLKLVPGLWQKGSNWGISGNNGTATFAKKGETRNVQLFPGMTIPGGATVFVYLGTLANVYAHLNDYSADVWINSSWKVNQVSMLTADLTP